MKKKRPLYRKLGFAFVIPRHLAPAVFKKTRKKGKTIWKYAHAYHCGDTFYDHIAGYKRSTKNAVRIGLRHGVQVAKLNGDGTIEVIRMYYGKEVRVTKPRTMTKQQLTQLLHKGTAKREVHNLG